MLHTTCGYRLMAYIPVCRCKVCKNGFCAAEGKAVKEMLSVQSQSERAGRGNEGNYRRQIISWLRTF